MAPGHSANYLLVGRSSVRNGSSRPNATANITRYKARLCAKGYSQIAGMDCEETFAPVVRIESVRVLFAIAAFFMLYILHVDCKTAFLNGDSDFIMFIQQPPGYINKRFPRHVLLLNNRSTA
jgi:hypothetical protein